MDHHDHHDWEGEWHKTKPGEDHVDRRYQDDEDEDEEEEFARLIAEEDDDRRQEEESIREASQEERRSHDCATVSRSSSPPVANVPTFVFQNDKAGMTGVDKEKINRVIYEMSKDSAYFKHAQKTDASTDMRITTMKAKLARFPEDAKKTLEAKTTEILGKLVKRQPLNRVCCVIDGDQFFAAVELRDRPDLQDKPVAVGGTGMISTANYVARKYGVRSAMPGFIAKKLCPQLIFIAPNFSKYQEAARLMQDVYAEYDSAAKAYSLDESYLDLTEYVKARAREQEVNIPPEGMKEGEEEEEEEEEEGKGREEHHMHKYGGYWRIAQEVVQEIRAKVYQKTRLSTSAGIGLNFVHAKIGADVNKPNGQFFLEDPVGYMRTLPVRKVPGIGKVMEKILKEALGIHTCGDLYNKRASIFHVFKPRTAHWLLRMSIGLGSYEEEETSEDSSTHRRKGISRERTFTACSRLEEQLARCRELCEGLAEDMVKENNLQGRTVTLKLKTTDFDVRTRAITCPHFIHAADDLYRVASTLLTTECQGQALSLRLMGIRVSNFLTQKESIESFLRKSTSPQEVKVASSLSEANKLPAAKGDEHSSTKEEEGEVEVIELQGEKVGRTRAQASGSRICPICEQPLPLSNAETNKHIDTCLGVETPKEFSTQSQMKYTSSNASKKRHSSSSSSQSKKGQLAKAQKLATGGRSIESFFASKP